MKSVTAGTLARPAINVTNLQRVLMVLAGVGILTASAYLSVPFYPVPMTMQTLAVMLIAGAMGPYVSVTSVLGYLAIGAMGAPVFHNGLGGAGVFAGPTAGYLIGFVPAAFVVGLAGRYVRKSATKGVKETLVLAVACIVASAIVYAIGVPWLSYFTGKSLSVAWTVGAVHFFLGDALKIAVAVAAFQTTHGVMAKRGWLAR
jgi:biotin transport system substrate-specific component